MEKKLKLKKILTTASALAMLMGASTEALGGVVVSTTGAAQIGNGGVNVQANGGSAGGNFANDDSIAFGDNGHTLITTAASTIAAIDINGKAPGVPGFTVAHATTLGSVFNAGVAVPAANHLHTVVNDGITLTLNGAPGLNARGVAGITNDYSALGNITLGSGHGASTLAIDIAAAVIGGVKSIVLNGTINSDVANDGKITIAADNIVTFNGIIGATHKLAKLQLEDNAVATFNAAATIDKIALNHANAQAIVGAGVTITGDVDNIVGGGGGGAGSGILTFVNGGSVSGKIGESNALTKIDVLAGAVTFGTGGQTVKSAALNLAGATSVVNIINSKNITITTIKLAHATAQVNVADEMKVGAITGEGGDDVGILTFAGAGTATGTVGATKTLNNIIVKGTGNKVVTFDAATKAKMLTTANNNNGTVIFKAASEIAQIGASDKVLNQVEVTGGVALTLGGNEHYAKTFKLSGNAGAQITAKDKAILHGNIINDKTGNGIILFAANGAIDGTVGTKTHAIAKVSANAAANAAIVEFLTGGDHFVTGLEIADNANAGFKFADGVKINGEISALGHNGIVEFVGGGEVTGDANGKALTVLKIGAAGDKGVKLANIKTASVEFTSKDGGGTLEVTKGLIVGNGVSTTYKFAKGGTLKLDGAQDHTFGAIDFADASGEINVILTKAEADKTVTFNQIQSAAAQTAMIGKLNVDFADKAGTIKFAGNAAANVNILSHTGGNLTLELNNSGAAVAGGPKFASIGLLETKAENITIKFTKTDSLLKLGALNAAKPENVKISVAEDSTFASVKGEGTGVFGTAENPYAELKFGGAKTFALTDLSLHVKSLLGANGTLELRNADLGVIDAIPDNNKLASIVVKTSDKGAVSRLTTKMRNLGDVVVNEKAILEISNDIVASKFNGEANNKGTLRFKNANAITVAGSVGGANTLAALEFAGRDVKFAAGNENMIVHKADVIFSSDDAMTVTLNDATVISGADTATLKLINKSKAIHTIVLTNKTDTAYSDFQGSIAADNHGANQLNILLSDGVKVFELGANSNTEGANFITATDNSADFIFSNAIDKGGVVNSIGSENKRFKQVAFAQSGKVKNGLFATDAAVVGDMTATLGGTISVTNGLKLGDGKQTKIIFADRAINNSVIKANEAGNGIVEFESKATINADLGEAKKLLLAVNFSGKGNKDLNANVYSQNILIANQGSITLGKSVEFNGVTNVASGTITLNNHALTINSGALAFFDQNVINSSTDGTNVGHIVVTDGAVLTFDAKTKIDVNVDVRAVGRVGSDETRSYTIIDNQGTVNAANSALNLFNVKVSGSGFLSGWTPELTATGGLQVTESYNAKVQISKLFNEKLGKELKANIDELIKYDTKDQSAYKILALIDQLGGSNPDKVKEVLNGLSDAGSVSDMGLDVVSNATDVAARTIETRIHNIANIDAAARVAAPAAGDESSFGAWLNPFYGSAEQQARKGAKGYKEESFGGALGFDAQANENLVIGAAAVVSETKLKHKENKGSKTKADSMQFSVYGIQQINDAIFVQGVGTVGSTQVKNTDKRVATATTYDAVTGKFKVVSFSGEAIVGYNFVGSEKTVVTPMAGLKYTRLNGFDYKETGSTTGQNFSVNAQAVNKLEVIAGARVAVASMDMNGIFVTPEAHAFVAHDTIAKRNTPTVNLDKAKLSVNSSKPQATRYNLGVSINAQSDMFEYGVGYDANIAEQRLGHQGTLKLRVNF